MCCNVLLGAKKIDGGYFSLAKNTVGAELPNSPQVFPKYIKLTYCIF